MDPYFYLNILFEMIYSEIGNELYFGSSKHVYLNIKKKKCDIRDFIIPNDGFFLLCINYIFEIMNCAS